MPKVIKVDRPTPLHQVEYLQMLGEVLRNVRNDKAMPLSEAERKSIQYDLQQILDRHHIPKESDDAN